MVQTKNMTLNKWEKYFDDLYDWKENVEVTNQEEEVQTKFQINDTSDNEKSEKQKGPRYRQYPVLTS